MKVESRGARPTFDPIVVEVTIESAAEMDVVYSALSHYHHKHAGEVARVVLEKLLPAFKRL